MPANTAGVIKKHRVREVPPDPAAGAPAAGGGRAQVRLAHQDTGEVPATIGQPVSPETADAPQPNKEAAQ